MSTRYEDNSAAFLRAFVEDIAPTVEAMGDLLLERIQSKIQVQDTPSAPGEGPATPTRKYLESWKRSRVLKRPNRASCIVYSPAKTDDEAPTDLRTELLTPILEYGRPEINLAARPHVRPALDEARSTLVALAKDALQ